MFFLPELRLQIIELLNSSEESQESIKMKFNTLRQEKARHSLSLQLNLDQERTYTTLDKITGSLTAVATTDTDFDGLEIHLIGTSKTCGLRYSHDTLSQQRLTTTHRFLDLAQPDLVDCLPESKCFAAEARHVFPFDFTMPAQMLPTQCRHGTGDSSEHRAHTLLPPTFVNHSTDRTNDRTTEIAVVEYMIVAQIWRGLLSRGKLRRSVVAECSKSISFMPRREFSEAGLVGEVPAMYKEVPMKYCWKRRRGKLLVSVKGSGSPIELRPSRNDSGESTFTGMAELMLQYHPEGCNAQPPQLGNLNTLFSTTTCSMVASNVTGDTDLHERRSSCHSRSISLSSRPVQHIVWTKSSVANKMCDSISAVERYSTKISAPIVLTDSASLVPAFHSCLVSRAYSIVLKLSFSSASGFRNTSLEMPVDFDRPERSSLQSEMDAHNVYSAPVSGSRWNTTSMQGRAISSVLLDEYSQQAPPAYDANLPS